MKRFINTMTGTEMWVADNRVDEYKAAGHKLAADVGNEVDTKKPADDDLVEAEPKEAVEAAPKKTRTKKTTAKRT